MATKITIKRYTSGSWNNELYPVTDWSYIKNKPSNYTPSSHTHNYAGSSSAGGAATSANKLNTNAGSATQPVYFSSGVPVATTYSLGKSVPSDAVFTDTHNSHTVYSGLKSDGTTNIASTTSSTYLTLGDSGVTAGTYKRVTVNAKGIVIGGDNTDANDNTWRKVQLNGTDKLGTGTNTNPLNIKAGSNMTITESSGTFTFAATNTWPTNYLVSASKSGSTLTVTDNAGNSYSLTDTNTDTNTHYTTRIQAASASNGTVPTTSDTSNPYLVVTDDNVNRNAIQIVGSGATSVTAKNNVITISSTDTNTNTTYSAGTGMSLSGTTFNHSNSVTAQTTQAVYPIKIDAQGHISAYGSAVTIPTNTNQLTNGAGYITSSALSGYATQTWVTNKGYITSASLPSVSSNNNTASWGSAVTVGTVGGVDLKFTMPSNPNTNTNYYHTRVYSSGLKISTGTGVSDMYVPSASTTQAGVLKIGTSATDAAAGNHTHSYLPLNGSTQMRGQLSLSNSGIKFEGIQAPDSSMGALSYCDDDEKLYFCTGDDPYALAYEKDVQGLSTAMMTTLTQIGSSALSSAGSSGSKTFTLGSAHASGDIYRVYITGSGSYAIYPTAMIQFKVFTASGSTTGYVGQGSVAMYTGSNWILVNARVAGNTTNKNLEVYAYALTNASGAPAGVTTLYVSRIERIRDKLD